MIDASAVKELRQKTGAGIMDCKKALLASNNDFELATTWLRTKGLANAAAIAAGRVAIEGLAAVKVAGTRGAIIEVNSETDFVARNAKFQELVSSITDLALQVSDLEALKATKLANGQTVSAAIIENIAAIGENLNLRRVDFVQVAKGVIGHYVHNHVAEGLGKIAVIVGIESDADRGQLESLAKQIAMHIAAAKPQSLNVQSLDQNLVKRERDIFTAQFKASGKPDNIIEKMVEGKTRKFYEDVVLLEQIFVIDGKTKIADLINNTAKELNCPINITGFVRFEVGEGILQASNISKT